MIRNFFVYICAFFMVCCYHKQLKFFPIRTLPMDSSLAIIMETAGLLSDSCLPDCWPRNFSIKKPSAQYIAYIQKSAYRRDIEGRKKFEKSKRNFPEVDSSFYSLIDDATVNYATAVKGQELTIEDVRSLTNKRVKVGLINGLKEKLADNELGYIQLSPVITNVQGDKGVYFYQLLGEISICWLICIQKQAGKWVLVSKSRLAIS